jgi:DNA-binding XRE family transcriptional regulator
MTERKRKPVHAVAPPEPKPERQAKAKPTRKPKSKPARKPKSARKLKPAPSGTFELAAWNRDFGESEVINAFARNVRAARERSGLSQRQVADIINYSRVSLVNMEGGKNGCTLPTMLRLCTVYGCTPNDLLKS